MDADSTLHPRNGLKRLALFVGVAFVACFIYEYGMTQALFPGLVRQDYSRLAMQMITYVLPVLVCFAASIWVGLWRKDGKIGIRFFTAIACFAVPFVSDLTALAVFCSINCKFDGRYL